MTACGDSDEAGPTNPPPAAPPPTAPPGPPPPDDSPLVAGEIGFAEARFDSIALAEALGLSAGTTVTLRGPGRRVEAAVTGGWLLVRPPVAWSGVDTVRLLLTRLDGVQREAILPLRIGSGPYAVTHDPYAGVDWSRTGRWKVQLHDHPGTISASYQAYDRAGYHAVALMDYSGVPSLPYAWPVRRWPPEQWLPAATLAGFTSIRFLFPGAEEVGALHITSPFLTEWIAKWEPGTTPSPAPWEYTTMQGAIDRVREYGGMPIVAHPWNDAVYYETLTGYTGLEIYSAFAHHRYEEGKEPFFALTDRNAVMVALWDRLLRWNPRIIGVAVNDHFGPDSREVGVSARTRDSGKVLVLAETFTPATLRGALERGAFFAVADVGAPKDRFLGADAVRVDAAGIRLETAAAVLWISGGAIVATGPDLRFAVLPPGTTYVRAEMHDAEGSVVYTQAFGLGLVGDQDGDRDVDETDAAIARRRPPPGGLRR